jgi:hypothetical protein
VSRIPEAVIAEVDTRAAGLCELCGWPLLGRAEYHHRQARLMGGGRGRDLDVAVNLMRLHPPCHRYAHSKVDEARDHGWIVPSWGRPDTQEVRYRASKPW